MNSGSEETGLIDPKGVCLEPSIHACRICPPCIVVALTICRFWLELTSASRGCAFDHGPTRTEKVGGDLAPEIALPSASGGLTVNRSSSCLTT